MKIIYFGTPEFAQKPLESLFKSYNIEIIAVITQPDKPQGRKQVMTASPVKQLAESLKIKVIQPANSKELLENLKKLPKADFFVVIAYGMILSSGILKMPNLGSINVHGSLLPKYRGASPIQESLLHGDKETGISIMKMDSKMDHGDIYLLKKVAITPDDTYESLSQKLSETTAHILPHALEDIYKKTLSPISQNHQKATYCHKINKDDGKINFKKTAEEIKNMSKAFTPWPGVFTEFNGKKLKILETNIIEEQLNPGEFKIENKILKIGTKKGCLTPSMLQIEGKNVMDVKAFINGYQSLIK